MRLPETRIEPRVLDILIEIVTERTNSLKERILRTSTPSKLSELYQDSRLALAYLLWRRKSSRKDAA